MPGRTVSVIFSAALLLLVAACAHDPAASVVQPTGAQTYATHCSACHGTFGEGDGPVANSLRGTVPNLRLLSERNGGSFPADSVASYIDGRDLPAAHGDRVMPVWGDVFDATSDVVPGADPAARRIDELIDFLRRIQSN